VNDWETRWDEDEDEEEEEEEEEEVDYQGQQQKQQQPLPPPSPPQIHPQMRPDMDTGYSSAAAAVSSPMPGPGQNIYISPAQQEPPYSTSTTPTRTKAHLVTATPETPGTSIPVTDDDGVEWDTGMTSQLQQLQQQEGKDILVLTEKPNVEQFLPLLRVLGKGSFGKVRSRTCL
jgi:hypothetical protein